MTFPSLAPGPVHTDRLPSSAAHGDAVVLFAFYLNAFDAPNQAAYVIEDMAN